MVKFTSASHNVNVEGGSSSHTYPFAESISVSFRDFLVLDKGSKSQSELMFTIVLPYTSEVGFVGKLGWHFVWELDVVLLKDFWSKFTKVVPFSLELFTTLGSGGVNTEDDWLFLISVSEGVENSVTLAIIVLVIEHVATVSPSGWLWDFVVEKSS